MTRLTALSSTGPNADRRRQAWFAKPQRERIDELVALALAMQGVTDAEVDALASLAGLPSAEVMASPFALRSVALAVACGASTVNHESRAEVPWPDAFERDPAVANDPHGYWDRGVLHAGKYRGFMQDEPFARYNPNHMSKWGPHELTHRTCGFLWHPNISRWENYLGARLNEMVPVFLWYGLDEVARLDRVGFDRTREAAERAASRDQLVWRTASADELRRRITADIDGLDAAWNHFEAELAAVDNEVSTGVVTPVDHAFLDASSDAIAYVVGHHDRLTSDAFRGLGEVVFSGESGDALGVHEHVVAYRNHVADTLDALLFSELTVDVADARRRRDARQVLDLAHRAAHHARCRPDSTALSVVQQAVIDGFSGEPVDVESAWEHIAAQLPRSAAQGVRANGFHAAEMDATHHDVPLFRDGLASIAPATLAALDDLDWSPTTLLRPSGRTDLVARWAAQVDAVAGDAPWLAALFAFERAIAACRLRDDRPERLNDDVLPDGAGVVTLSDAFRCVAFDCDPVPVHGHWAETGEIEPALAGASTAYLIGAAWEGVSVVPAPAQVQLFWQRAQEGPLTMAVAADVLTPSADAAEAARSMGLPDSGIGWLDELAGACAVLVVPSLAGG